MEGRELHFPYKYFLIKITLMSQAPLLRMSYMVYVNIGLVAKRIAGSRFLD